MAECIERDKAISALEKWDRAEDEGLTIEGAQFCLLGLPAADVAPVLHGTWDKPLDRRRKSAWCCSECKNITYATWAYCPNCGAKMDGGGKP